MNKEHHVWCNYYHKPREGCEMCKRLYEAYPDTDRLTPDELLKKYFPDAVLRTRPETVEVDVQ